MIGKQSQPDIIDEDNQSRIKLIANKRRFLEEKSAQVYNFQYHCTSNFTFISLCVLFLQSSLQRKICMYNVNV